MRFSQKRCRLALAIAGLAPLSSGFTCAAGPTASPGSLANEMLVLERTVRDVPETAESTLSLALAGAIRALGDSPRTPASPEEAIAASIKISTALAKANFLQPLQRKDWVSTIGEALVPRSFAAAELDAMLMSSGNAARAPFVNRGRPIYYVDCDMGSLLIMSVAKHFGWDVRLVEVPDHNFIRWHLSDGRTVNWDWTNWESIEDSAYLPDTGLYRQLRRRGIYLRSFDAAESRAYYVGLIGSKARSPRDGTPLLEKAIEDGARDPATYNNLAWNYITRKDIAEASADVSILHALTAWSARPDHGNTVDTVACAFATAGKKSLALALEDFAAEHAQSEKELEGFKKNRERIANGASCE